VEPLALAEAIKERFPDQVLGTEAFRDQVTLDIRREGIVDLCRTLHDDTDFAMDFLADLCGVDFLGKRTPRYAVVYNLYSMTHRHRIILRAGVPEDDPRIDSVVPIWIGADWHEREAYDMYGISFTGHPDLRRVLMPEDYEGHPLRKDYPVKGPGPEGEWQGYLDVEEKARRFEEFRWKP